MRLRSTVPAAMLALSTVGCGDVSELATVNARLTDGESMFVGVEVSSSAAGVELEVDWRIELISFGATPCPVAVYRWLDELPAGDELPSETAEGWPQTWDGGELIASAVVPAGEAIELEQRLDEPRDGRVGGLLGLATCEGSRLDAIVEVEAAADLGIRAAFDALVVDLWRAG